MTGATGAIKIDWLFLARNIAQFDSSEAKYWTCARLNRLTDREKFYGCRADDASDSQLLS